MQRIVILTGLFLFPIASLSSEDQPKSLSLEYARRIAMRTEAYAMNKKWKISIAVVNSEGNLLYFQRNPEAYSGSIEAAIQKAKSSSAFQRPTSAFVDGIKQGRTGLLTLTSVAAIEGGMPIVLNGQHVGAMGVSGAKSTEDEEAARAGLQEVK
jgi:glc operon protein GlcG